MYILSKSKKRKKFYIALSSIMTSMLVAGYAGTPASVVQADEPIAAITGNADISDLLTASIVFRDGDAVYSQPFLNFLPVNCHAGTGMEAYSALAADSKVLDQYIDTINQLLSYQTYEQASFDMSDEVNGVYRTGTYIYQFGKEARDYVMEQIAYHAIGGLFGDVVIDTSQVPLEKVYLNGSEALATITLIGSYQTDYRTSSAGRCTNIEVAAGNFNGLLVRPGETISVSKTFKPRKAENGYQIAGIFLDGEVAQGMGGGICQVSTTIYCASKAAGLTIVERHTHSLPVSYVPSGMDATISDPNLDLKLRNDLSTPIIFKTKTENKKVTVEVYSIVEQAVSSVDLEGSQDGADSI